MADAKLDAARACLGETLRVTLSDGRVVEGEFKGFDEGLNILMRGAVERRRITLQGADGAEHSEERERRAGTVMLPGSHIVACEGEGEAWAALVG